MTTAEHSIKSMIDDLQTRRASLKAQMREFEQLQQDITRLQRQAEYDPVARRKLRELVDTMRNGGSELQTLFEEKLFQLQNSLEVLDYHFRQLLSSPPLPPRYERQLPRCYNGLRHIHSLL